jgi:hypothetical protein
MATPLSVQYKIFRAQQHFHAFITELDGYIQQNLCGLKIDADPSQNSLPPHLSLILGDGLQNLRSALDYLVFELVVAAQGEPTKFQTFPVCESAAAFKDATQGKKFQGLPKNAIAEIEALQPYHAGDSIKAHPFWVLNHLVNINKHRRILLVRLRKTTAGRILGTNKYEQVTEGASSKLYVDLHPAIYVALDETSFPDKPEVSALIDQLVKAIELILPNFDQFF